MTSVSLVVSNATPFAVSSSRSLVALTRLPLCPIITGPIVGCSMRIGCALLSFALPVVL